VSEVHVVGTQISDDQVRAMLAVFAGPATPQPPAGRTKRRATRRTVIVLVAGLVALGLAVPGALALLGYWETPKQFLADSSQPAYAKRVVRQWLTNHGYRVRPGDLRLVALTRGVTASTPAGDIRAYALRFGRGEVGFWVFTGQNRRDPFVYVIAGSKAKAGPNRVWYRPCPSGWALQYLIGTAFRVGRTPGFTLGRATSTVASVYVRYRDGSTTRGAVSDGYFVVWIKPSAAWTTVTVIAKNAAGRTIARLMVGGYGEVPSWSVRPTHPFACAR
jgi:hypothetical protein